MPRIRHEDLKKIAQPLLTSGEQVEHIAYGVQQPPFWVILLMMTACIGVPMFLFRGNLITSALVAGVAGGIAGMIIFFMSKHLAIALTGQKLLLIQFRYAKGLPVLHSWSIPVADFSGRFRTFGLITSIKLTLAGKNWLIRFNRKLSSTVNGQEIDAIKQKMVPSAN
ncbi:MAG: hypothetical protein JNK86_06630 [Alphaproteobacteria bacterium]|nr:hypothetical protein [Alphaproteobacteria bacterium]